MDDETTTTTTYDAASMKVDEDTWALLQSTHHQERMMMIQGHLRIMKVFLGIPCCLLVFFMVCHGGGGVHLPSCGGFLPLMVGAVAFFLGKICAQAVDRQTLQVYQNVTTIVNEALRQRKDAGNNYHHVQVAVEFHTTELPGREGKLSRRYQFVPLLAHNTAPTTTHDDDLV